MLAPLHQPLALLRLVRTMRTQVQGVRARETSHGELMQREGARDEYILRSRNSPSSKMNEV
uniref:Uncharacterized protein n=1 Tax=Pristionchus pacificus TaxID=54126 RepID=A0A2A6BT13_PRIPA|eukprot:PDM69079.1 hypothetical protein PRIPAC_47381 [Pristionchus pacificus]